MANITEIRDTVVTRGRSLLGEAAKPVYACIGAGDVVRSHVVTLPARAQERLKGIRETLPDSPAAVRDTVENYGATALNGFAELSRRGERVVETVRHRSTDVAEPADVIDQADAIDQADVIDEADEASADSVEAPIARAAKKATTPRAPRSAPRRAPADETAQRGKSTE